MNSYQKKLLLIGILLVIGIVALILGILRNNEPVGTSIEYFEPDGPAIMNNSEELYRALNNDIQFNTLRESLGIYARKTIDIYKDGTVGPIVYVVESFSDTEETVSFTGAFTEYEQEITVSVVPKNYNKLFIDIRDENNTSINAELPANNKLNQFIADLPINHSDYSIEYIPSEDKIAINIYERDPTLYDVAENEIKQKLNLTDVSELEIEYVFPSIVGN